MSWLTLVMYIWCDEKEEKAKTVCGKKCFYCGYSTVKKKASKQDAHLFVCFESETARKQHKKRKKQKTKHKKTHTQNTQNQNVVVVWVYIYMFKCQNNNTIQTKQCLLRIVYICRQFDIHTRQTTHLICVCALHVCSSCALFASFFSFFFLFFTKKRNEKREKNLFFWGWNGNGNGFGGRRNAIRKKRRKDYIVFLSFFPTTNRENKGLISVDRSNKATLLLTIPRSCI